MLIEPVAILIDPEMILMLLATVKFCENEDVVVYDALTAFEVLVAYDALTAFEAVPPKEPVKEPVKPSADI